MHVSRWVLSSHVPELFSLFHSSERVQIILLETVWESMGQKGHVCHKAECCLLVLPLPQVRETETKAASIFIWLLLKGMSIQFVEDLFIKEEMIVYSSPGQVLHLPKEKHKRLLKPWPCMCLFICQRCIVCCKSEVKLSSNLFLKCMMIQMIERCCCSNSNSRLFYEHSYQCC